MLNYYVKWNSKIQKRFSNPQKAMDWVYGMKAKFPTNIPYTCYYRDGTVNFTI